MPSGLSELVVARLVDLAHHDSGMGVQLSHDMKTYLANCGCGVWSAQMLASIGASTPVAFLSNREAIGIYTKEVIFGGGNIHCITQQQPAV